MKAKALFLAVLAAIVMTGSAKAQIQVNSDGGVRIGTAPEPLSGPAKWSLTTQGLEVNYDDIIFHTKGSGQLNLTGESRWRFNAPSTGGSVTVPATLVYTYLTGVGLCLGTTSSPVWSINTQDITSKNDIKITSDRRAKENIRAITGARETVMRLNPVTFDLKAWEDYMGDGEDLKGKAGFIAQEVLEVLPEAVGYDAEIDQYSLSYAHFIPYLTQTIQEQDARILELEDRIAQLEELVEGLLPASAPAAKNRNDNTAKTSKSEVPAGATLYQNTPNPFSESTLIRYTLDKPANATLVVMDMKGRTVYRETLKKGGLAGQVEIPAGRLAPGLYTYSLVSGTRTLATKKMTVTE